MYKRIVELGETNPMACLIKDLVKYLTGTGIVYLIDRYIKVDKTIINILYFVFGILFITSLVHKYIIDKIIGAGSLECPIEGDNRTVEENITLKHELKKKINSDLPPMPEVNKTPQQKPPMEPNVQMHMMRDEHIPMMPQQMNTPPPQFDMGGYQTLY